MLGSKRKVCHMLLRLADKDRGVSRLAKTKSNNKVRKSILYI